MSQLEVEQALVLRLLSDSAVAALAGDRLYPNVAPANASAPYLVYARVGRQDISRDLNQPGNLVQPRIQIDSYAVDYATAKALGRAIRQALDGFRGSISDTASPPATLRIAGIALNIETDFYESSTDPKLHRLLQDFTLTIDEQET